MTTDIVIRLARPADYDAWKPLWDGYNAFYGRSGVTALPDDVTRLTWSRFHDDAEPMFACVAERGDELLGIVHYLFHRTTIHERPTCYLQDLFTVESSRGRGVGRALIDEVARAARAAGSARVYWLTHETNTQAMVLYDQVAEKSGFLVYRKPV
jgi:GNAT superfamily N-acetyltransferase